MDKRKIQKNIILSVIAQVISFMVSFLLNLVVPKFIDEISYANWQLYVLYVSYVGVLHFGLLDGLVLRYSQYDYDELDKKRVRSQFLVLLVMTGVMMGITMAVSAMLNDTTTAMVYCFVALGMIIKNVYTYSSYTFQITNRINEYVFLVISDRVIYGVFVIILLALKVNDFTWYCVADLTSDCIGIAISSRFNKGLYFGTVHKIKEIIEETKKNISSGIILLLANWSAIVLVGSAKMVVQWRWEKLIFGKVSFAFSISNLFLTMAAAVSVVLFPSLKRMKTEELPGVYSKIRNTLVPLLLIAMLLYFPGCELIDLFIPKYSESLPYLGIILPIVIPSCLISLLTNNYFKAYRKEKSMLFINMGSVLVGFAVFCLFGFGLHNLKAILISLVCINVLRTLISELVVSKIISISVWQNYIPEVIMMVVFAVATCLSNRLIGGGIYLAVLVAYCIIERRKVMGIFSLIRRKKDSTK